MMTGQEAGGTEPRLGDEPGVVDITSITYEAGVAEVGGVGSGSQDLTRPTRSGHRKVGVEFQRVSIFPGATSGDAGRLSLALAARDAEKYPNPERINPLGRLAEVQETALELMRYHLPEIVAKSDIGKGLVAAALEHAKAALLSNSKEALAKRTPKEKILSKQMPGMAVSRENERLQELVDAAPAMGVGNVLELQTIEIDSEADKEAVEIERRATTERAFSALGIPVYLFPLDGLMHADGDYAAKIIEAERVKKHEAALAGDNVYQLGISPIISRMDTAYPVSRGDGDTGRTYEVILLVQDPNDTSLHYLTTIKPSYVQAPGEVTKTLVQVDAVAINWPLVPWVNSIMEAGLRRQIASENGVGTSFNSTVLVDIHMGKIHTWASDPNAVGLRDRKAVNVYGE